MQIKPLLSQWLWMFFAASVLLASCGGKKDPPPKPTVDFNFSPADPTTETAISFTATATNAQSFSWTSNPAGFSSTQQNPTHTFTTPGTYNVTLTAIGEGGSTNVSKQITVKEPAPVVDFSFSPTAPQIGQAVTFTATVRNGNVFEWSSSPAGFASTQQNPSHVFSTAGSFQITLRVSGPGGSTSVSKTLTVTAPAPVASFSFSPASPRVGEQVSFTAEVQNATTFEWSSTPAGFSSTQQNPSHTFTTAGTYQIRLKATGPGGTVEVNKELIVAPPLPVVDFSFAPASPRVGEAVNFTAQAQNATAFEWSSSPAGFSSTQQNPSHTFTTAGTYQVTLKATGPGGSTSVTKAVVVSGSGLVANFTFSPASPKAGEAVTFTNTSTGTIASYSWSSTPAGFSSTQPNPSYTFSNAGDYDVTLTIRDNLNNTASVTKKVSVAPAGGGTGNNNCNTGCYPTKVTANTAAGAIVSTYEYVTLSGLKQIKKVTVSGGGTNSVTEYEYDGQGRNTRIVTNTTVFGFTVRNTVVHQFNAAGKISRGDNFDNSNTLTGYFTHEYNGEFLVRTNNYNASGQLVDYVLFEDFIAPGFFQRERNFSASGALQSDTRITYQNCTILTLVSRDASGTIVLEQNGQIDGKGLLRRLTIINRVPVNVTSTADYEYDCD